LNIPGITNYLFFTKVNDMLYASGDPLCQLQNCIRIPLKSKISSINSTISKKKKPMYEPPIIAKGSQIHSCSRMMSFHAVEGSEEEKLQPKAKLVLENTKLLLESERKEKVERKKKPNKPIEKDMNIEREEKKSKTKSIKFITKRKRFLMDENNSVEEETDLLFSDDDMIQDKFPPERQRPLLMRKAKSPSPAVIIIEDD
jgi:hypothetical protein